MYPKVPPECQVYQTEQRKLYEDDAQEDERKLRNMKVSRHAKIIELIGQHDIETQEELAEYLNKEGFKVTQATVSRDIRDLNLTKGIRWRRKAEVRSSPSGRAGINEKYIRVLQRRICVHGYGPEYSCY